MKIAKLIHASPSEIDTHAIKARLTKFLLDLRSRKLAKELVGDDERSESLDSDNLTSLADELSDGVELTWGDDNRINTRIARLSARRKAASGFAHLKDNEIRRLRPLMSGVRLEEPQTIHWADEVASALHEEMPWMAPATKEVWYALRHNAVSNQAIRLPPLLLNGPPGLGKSVWARRLSELLRVPRCEIDASVGGVGFSVVGVERGWSSAQPGRPLETILKHKVANPLVVIDEVCKSQSASTEMGARHSFADSLLNLLETETSATWVCPFFQINIDMSHISWVMTANEACNIPSPLLSRCTVVDLACLSSSQLKAFARRQALEVGLSGASTEAIEHVIDRWPKSGKTSISFRTVSRMLRRAEVLERRSAYH